MVKTWWDEALTQAEWQKPVEDWEEYFWDEEWFVQGTSLGIFDERPEHVTAQFMAYKPTKKISEHTCWPKLKVLEPA